MFTLTDLPVKFIGLLILFLWCTAWCVYELTRRQDRTQRVSNALHLMMAVVMLLMVARTTWQPLVKVVPLSLILGLFVLSTLWFVGLALTQRGVRAHYAGHAAMFGAMTWHLAGMSIKMPHMGPSMKMWMMEASKPGGSLWIVALVGLPFMAYLLVASVRDLVLAVRPAPVTTPAPHEAKVLVGAGAPAEAGQVAEHAGCHEPRPTASPTFRLAALAGFAMNFGMFWMSTGPVTPILPWMQHLAF